MIPQHSDGLLTSEQEQNPFVLPWRVTNSQALFHNAFLQAATKQ